jgi:hypothetical protein
MKKKDRRLIVCDKAEECGDRYCPHSVPHYALPLWCGSKKVCGIKGFECVCRGEEEKDEEV